MGTTLLEIQRKKSTRNDPDNDGMVVVISLGIVQEVLIVSWHQ